MKQQTIKTDKICITSVPSSGNGFCFIENISNHRIGINVTGINSTSPALLTVSEEENVAEPCFTLEPEEVRIFENENGVLLKLL